MTNADFEMPSTRELELELALGSESWRSLLATDESESERPPTPGRRSWESISGAPVHPDSKERGADLR